MAQLHYRCVLSLELEVQTTEPLTMCVWVCVLVPFGNMNKSCVKLHDKEIKSH